MELFKKVSVFLADIDDKDFYKYLSAFFIVLIAALSFIIYSYYSDIGKYASEIEFLNSTTRENVKNILTKSANIENRSKEVLEMIKKDPAFNLTTYIEEVLSKLNLSATQFGDLKMKETSGNYTESELDVELGPINMAQLCSLLSSLEEKKRIKINILEISKSEKKSDAIDVKLTISTLLLASEVKGTA